MGQEIKCLKVIKRLFSWYLKDKLICPLCHTFSFPSAFFSAPLPSSLSMCIWFSLPFPLPAFLCLYLSSTTLSPAPIYFLIGSPKWIFFISGVLSPRLSLCLAEFLPTPPALPHTTDTPLSMETFCLLFPSFEAISLKPFPVRKSQLDKQFHFELSKDQGAL